MKANLDIRRELNEANLPFWKLGILLGGISEMTVIRRLRTELSEGDKKAIREQIKKFTEGKEDDFTKKNFSKLKEMRCEHCNRLLGRCNDEAEVKCPKCHHTNQFNIREVSGQ